MVAIHFNIKWNLEGKPTEEIVHAKARERGEGPGVLLDGRGGGVAGGHDFEEGVGGGGCGVEEEAKSETEEQSGGYGVHGTKAVSIYGSM